MRLIKEETKVGNALCTLTVHKDEQNESSPKVQPKHFKCPLEAGSFIGHRSPPLNVIKWDSAQTKTLK